MSWQAKTAFEYQSIYDYLKTIQHQHLQRRIWGGSYFLCNCHQNTFPDFLFLLPIATSTSRDTFITVSTDGACLARARPRCQVLESSQQQHLGLILALCLPSLLTFNSWLRNGLGDHPRNGYPMIWLGFGLLVRKKHQ